MDYATEGAVGLPIQATGILQDDGSLYDWSTATGVFHVLYEDGTRRTWSATLSGSTMTYQTQAGDLRPGLILVEAEVSFADGRVLPFDSVQPITVRRRL